MTYLLETTSEDHIPGVVALQRECFPAPFPVDSLWQASHIANHILLFPLGQRVVTHGSEVVASCTNMLCSSSDWETHEDWQTTIGGLMLDGHNPSGSILFGVDISVHPNHRKRGLAKLLYGARFDLVRSLKLEKFGTVCRIPDFQSSKFEQSNEYVAQVRNMMITDRTLTPLLKLGPTYKGIIENYMEDEESGNAGVILEWTE